LFDDFYTRLKELGIISPTKSQDAPKYRL